MGESCSLECLANQKNKDKASQTRDRGLRDGQTKLAKCPWARTEKKTV